MFSRKFSTFLTLFILGCVSLFAQSNPVPLINNPLVPDAVAPGGPGFTLTVNGTGFVSGSVVDWNGTPLATTFVSGSQLTATVPAANIATPNTASVNVSNPLPGGGTSNIGFVGIRQPFASASFGQSSLNGGSDYPQSTLAVDVNGDGLLDLVGSGQGSIAVFLGNGDGTFQPPVNYPVELSGPVEAGDFNRDGKIDLVFIDQGTGNVAVMLGNGDGTFGPITEFSLSNSGICCLVVADFNRDGDLDVVAGLYTGEVAVLLGNGDGSLQNYVSYPAGTGDALGFAVGDFNQDGTVDIAVTVYSDNAISVLLGNGDGTFQSGVEYPTPYQPGNIVAADLNGDGRLDLAVGSDSSSLSILLGNGDGTFKSQVDYAVIGDASDVVAADMNGDGRIDLAVAAYLRNTFYVYLGNGDGTLRAPDSFPATMLPISVVVGDFNKDGLLDSIAAGGSGSGPQLFSLPQLTSVVSTTQLGFGQVSTGTRKILKVTLSNIGAKSLSINRVYIGQKNQVFRQSNSCGSELASGAMCIITVTFQPSHSGTFAGTLKILDSATSVPQQVHLSGTGT